MEDKQFLDEAGLGEVGKVISKHYASKEDLSKVDVAEQLADYVKKTEVPTKLSQLANDKSFKTEDEVRKLINDSNKLKKEVVTSLPATGVNDVVYLLKNKNDTNNYYTEYMWISNKWEIIGDTKIDLTDYAKKSDIKTNLSEMVEDNTHRIVTDEEKSHWNNKVDKVDGKGLSTNDYSNEDKQKIEEYKIQQRIDKARTQFSTSPSTFSTKILSEFLISGAYYLPRPNITWSISCENNIITINSQPIKQEMITKQQYNQAINYLSPTQCYMLYVEKIDEGYLVVQSNTQKCYIKQTLWDTTHGVQFCRHTKECKSEYSDSAMSSKIPLNTPSGSNHYFLSDEKWGDWFIPHDVRLYLESVDDQNKVPGLMSPENKRKLDSINIEEIKSLIQRVEALESKMH